MATMATCRRIDPAAPTILPGRLQKLLSLSFLPTALA